MDAQALRMRIHHLSCGTLCPVGGRLMSERKCRPLRGALACHCLLIETGQGLVLVSEVLVVTGTARETIRRPEGNPPLKDLIEKGTHPYGMQTFEMHLRQLFQQGVIDKEIARQAIGF